MIKRAGSVSIDGESLRRSFRRSLRKQERQLSRQAPSAAASDMSWTEEDEVFLPEKTLMTTSIRALMGVSCNFKISGEKLLRESDDALVSSRCCYSIKIRRFPVGNVMLLSLTLRQKWQKQKTTKDFFWKCWSWN